MSEILFVITHYMGASQFGFGDVILHTPLIAWAADVCGEPVDVGALAEVEWIIERCPAAGSFTEVRSAAEAVRTAAGRICIVSDCSTDEYPYHEVGLSYTSLIARRLGIPMDDSQPVRLLYETTARDRAEASKQLLSKRPREQHLANGLSHKVITANIRGRTRASNPGLRIDEHVELLLGLARDCGALVIVGDAVGVPLPMPLVSVETTLPVWAAMIEMSDLWVGECTGPYHLASALGTPTAMFSGSGMDNRAWAAHRYSDGRALVFEGVSGDRERLSAARRALSKMI
jgi:hypothetical protein